MIGFLEDGGASVSPLSIGVHRHLWPLKIAMLEVMFNFRCLMWHTNSMEIRRLRWKECSRIARVCLLIIGFLRHSIGLFGERRNGEELCDQASYGEWRASWPADAYQKLSPQLHFCLQLSLHRIDYVLDHQSFASCSVRHIFLN